jgi:hypothetical protein
MSGSGSQAGESGRNRPKTAATLAALGLVAATGLICGAVALRNPATVVAREHRRGVAPTAAAVAGTGSARGDDAPDPEPRATAAEPEAPPARTEPARAQATELENAEAAGIAALRALVERYPEDPPVVRALALAQGREKAFADALSTTKRLFEIAPEETGNDQVEQLILRIANGPPDVALTALDLMAKHMGSRGPDLLYEVVTGARFGDYPRDHASRLLHESSVRQLASPALIIADDLRRLSGCPTKAQLATARREGDVRALHYVKHWLTPHRCATNRRRTCIKCGSLHKDLRAAASAIEKRRNEKAAASASAPAASAAP